MLCAVAGCNNTNYKGKRGNTNNAKKIHFLSFPKDQILCKKICSEHFKSEDYKTNTFLEQYGLPVMKRLKPNTVPSINPPFQLKQGCANVRVRRLAEGSTLPQACSYQPNLRIHAVHSKIHSSTLLSSSLPHSQFEQPKYIAEASRIKCGNIFILSDENFSFVCEFCEHDFYSIEDFRLHIKEHFPKSKTNIKTEDPISCANDFESITPDIHYGRTNTLTENEHQPESPVENNLEETSSDCEYIPLSRHDDMMEFKDTIKYKTGSESFDEEFDSSRLNDNQFTEETIQSKQSKGQRTKLTLQSNSGKAEGKAKPVPLRIIRVKVNENNVIGSNHSKELIHIEPGSIREKPYRRPEYSKNNSL